ncbi:MAG: hypothetical protein AAF615_06515 [Pseudomonadota bacterium]
MKRTVTALIIAMGIAPVAAEPSSVPDITGTWEGKGFVQKDENARKINVRCEIEGEQSVNQVGFDGVCRAMLVMKREIGAWLTKSDNGFTGTYKGAEVGLAELDGGPEVDGKIVLEMKFPKEVNGDDLATMTINLENSNVFTITTTDVMLNGEEITTSEVTFVREKDVAEN